ncbi:MULTISPECIES: hypothetical protein [Metallosphaera]|uniref:Mechanosensitive ion channel protein MscS n=3 Tax=Metallosphaera TaxID=41980 RepID=A4YHD3_METS5|nr:MULTISPECIES: hypothetical protein [Metallosphaera]ABP95835.1 hypothetical protein Msed_1680 [Metallosphaera sedula DSM 5348]AIM27819.1 hypothetical protein HA72_1680 [Metallosphaera sedula]AKV74669.1 hypothetical protein MsedA_1714 [Metallosphaera sedula]AKV76906.1 hypothetical protein MsedB_1716 [Metallosphaera sedula]AKV79157.1 hypothetical protein MsedC_1714 [Metallosphaera sedula]
MFEVLLGVQTDPQRIRDIFKDMVNVLEGICSPVRIGASFLCSPSPSSLITVYLAEQEMRPMYLAFRIKSKDSQDIVNFSEKINLKLKDYGVHPTLINSDSTSL